MNIYFKEVIKATSIFFSQPDNMAEMNKKIRIHYSDTMTEDVELAQRDGVQVLYLQNTYPTKQIKIEVLQVYGTINNGFAAIIKGVKCKDEDDVKKVEDVKMDRISDDKLVLLKCSSNLTNTIGINKKIKSKTKVYCAESCQFKEKYKIYGNSV